MLRTGGRTLPITFKIDVLLCFTNWFCLDVLGFLFFFELTLSIAFETDLAGSLYHKWLLSSHCCCRSSIIALKTSSQRTIRNIWNKPQIHGMLYSEEDWNLFVLLGDEFWAHATVNPRRSGNPVRKGLQRKMAGRERVLFLQSDALNRFQDRPGWFLVLDRMANVFLMWRVVCYCLKTMTKYNTKYIFEIQLPQKDICVPKGICAWAETVLSWTVTLIFCFLFSSFRNRLYCEMNRFLRLLLIFFFSRSSRFNLDPSLFQNAYL